LPLAVGPATMMTDDRMSESVFFVAGNCLPRKFDSSRGAGSRR